MMTAGSARQEQAQRGLDDLVGRFLQRQYGNAEKLSEFSGMLGQPVMTNNAYNQAKSSNWSALWG